MAKVRIKVDNVGLGELLKSSDMAEAVRDSAEAIASAAGEGYAVTVEHDRRKSRVIAHVLGTSMKHEIETGALARAVGSQETSWTRR